MKTFISYSKAVNRGYEVRIKKSYLYIKRYYVNASFTHHEKAIKILNADSKVTFLQLENASQANDFKFFDDLYCFALQTTVR